MGKSKPLYGTDVCRRCYYRLVNRRQGAYVIDSLCWWFITFFIGLVIAGVWAVLVQQSTPGPAPGHSTGNSVLVLGILALDYVILPMMFLCKDGFSGHTPGRLLMGIRVVDQRTGEGIGFVASLKRNLVLIIPFAPIVVAFLLGKGYRVGDGWAKSRVIWKKYANHPVFGSGLRCEWCQYDLTGNTTGRCPECGALVSEANKRILDGTGVRSLNPV